MFKPLICLVAGLALSGFSARTVWEAKALDERAAVARVEPIQQYAVTKSRRSGNVQYFSADLEFVAASGERVRTNQILSSENINRASKGTLEISYLPDNPKVVRIGEGPKSAQEELIIGLVLSLIGALWLWRRATSKD
jgi:hypothetical protein